MNLTSAEFRRIVEQELGITGIRFTDHRCPDDYLAFHGSPGGLVDLSVENRVRVEERPKDRPCVVLVLESPHKREFTAQDGRVGPALGPTGNRIQRYLETILRQSGLWSQVQRCSGLVLVNSIQFQCSLGQATRLHRDRVFREVWRRAGWADCVERLRAGRVAGDLVLNACTRGQGIPLCDQVEHAVLEVIKARQSPSGEPNGLRLYHPFNWMNEARRQPLGPGGSVPPEALPVQA